MYIIPQIFKDGKIELAHRVYFEKAFGHIPAEKELNHLCKTPGCVNPAHLEAVTHKQNMAYSYDPSWNPFKEKCKHGHSLNGENLLFWSGKRHCRECSNRHSREYKTRLRELESK